MSFSSSEPSPSETGIVRTTAFISTERWVTALVAERQRLETDLVRLRERVMRLGLDDVFLDGYRPAWNEEPEVATDKPAPQAALALESLVALGGQLAPALAIMGRLRALLQDPQVELQEVVNVIRLDPALTVRVIQMSNSVLFGARGRFDSIEHAAGRLGFSEIYRLVGLAATRQLCQHDLRTYGLRAPQLWQTSLATAAGAEVLALKIGCDAGLAYTSGLFRTLGRVIIDGAGHGQVYPGEQSGLTMAEWERQTFGLTATEVTTALLAHWKFPAEIIAALRGYHEPLADSESNVGACVLNVACNFAARREHDFPGEAACWELNPAKLTLLGLDEEDVEACADQMLAHYGALCATAG